MHTRNHLLSINPQNIALYSTICGNGCHCMAIDHCCCQYEVITERFMQIRYLVFKWSTFLYFFLQMTLKLTFKVNEFHSRPDLLTKMHKSKNKSSRLDHSCSSYLHLCTFPGEWPWNCNLKVKEFCGHLLLESSPGDILQVKTVIKFNKSGNTCDKSPAATSQ
jgi:hypothetical protein